MLEVDVVNMLESQNKGLKAQNYDLQKIIKIQEDKIKKIAVLTDNIAIIIRNTAPADLRNIIMPIIVKLEKEVK